MRLHASGVCHSDQNAIDGTAETRCPAVLGHEGAGVVEALGPGIEPGRARRPRRALLGARLRRLRGVPARAAAALREHLAGDGQGGLLDGTTRLSRDGEPVYHYSLISSFAEACVVPERSCVVIPADVPFAVAGLVGCAVTTGVGAVWNTAGIRPGDRVAIFGCGGVGLSALLGAVAAGAAEIVAVDVGPERARRRVRAGRDRDGRLGRARREETAAPCARGRPAAGSTPPSRRAAASRRCSPRSSRPATAAPRF